MSAAIVSVARVIRPSIATLGTRALSGIDALRWNETANTRYAAAHAGKRADPII
jgi:hypothetical protein